MADEETGNKVTEERPLKSRNREKVYEEKLLKSVSKTHSVFAFLQYFGLDILVYGTVFIAGKRGFGIVWMIPPIFVLVIKDLWSAEREKRRFDEVIKTLRDEGNQLILADLNRLPPWVHYPDVERCNWLNKLLFQLWPFICTIAMDQIKNTIEPALSKYISGLKIQKASLGTLPPTVSGIKVYEKKVSTSHLVVDANVCYSGDCEFAISYRGVPGGVENFQLRGLTRIDFLLINTIPFIGGVEFSFLGLPQIDFVLTGVGSVGFTEETLRNVLNRLVSSYLVFPKKISMVWKEGDESDIREPEGVLRINVIEAKNLESKDISVPFKNKNESDPYAEVSYGSKRLYSRVFDDSSGPYWDLWCEFVKDENKAIVVKVMDKDFTSDDQIGTYSLSVSDIKNKGKIDSWVQLTGSKGSVHVRAFFLELSPPDDNTAKFPPEDLSFLSSYVLTILVKSAHNLLLPRSKKQPSATVKLTIGNDTQETKTVENNDNPVFRQTFDFFVNNPDFNQLRVKVVDNEAESEIGSFSYSLRKLLDRKNLEIMDQHFPLIDAASDSTVVVSMRLRAIKNTF